MVTPLEARFRCIVDLKRYHANSSYASTAAPLPTSLTPFAATPMHQTSVSQYDSQRIG